MPSSVRIHPSQLKGQISAPPSKSQTLRSILFASLSEGSSVIHNPLQSQDTLAMIHACQTLGANIVQHQSSLTIQGRHPFLSSPKEVYVGNSGITLRFLTTIAALSTVPITFTGPLSVKKRPMMPLLSTLAKAGARISLYPPQSTKLFTIQGPLYKISHTPHLSVLGRDSQFVSALLIALPLLETSTKLTVIAPGEKPWVALTLKRLKDLKIHIEHNELLSQFFIPGAQKFSPFEYHVPTDFSSLAFLIAAGLISGDPSIKINNIFYDEQQGDFQIFPLLKQCGANIHLDDNFITASRSSWTGFEANMNNFIDATPILSTLALYATSPSKLYNAAIASTKECNRLLCTSQELRKLDAIISSNNSSLSIYPSRLVGSSSLLSHEDHRLAMSLSVAALKASSPSIIQRTSCVKKTFPEFYNLLRRLHANIDFL